LIILLICPSFRGLCLLTLRSAVLCLLLAHILAAALPCHPFIFFCRESFLALFNQARKLTQLSSDTLALDRRHRLHLARNLLCFVCSS
jgi:hypothetical protein